MRVATGPRGSHFSQFHRDPGPTPEQGDVSFALDTFLVLSHSPVVRSTTTRPTEPSTRPTLPVLP